MNNCLSLYYRCPEGFVAFAQKGSLSAEGKYFRFGKETTCYGAYCRVPPSGHPAGTMYDALSDTEVKNGTIFLPFDPGAVIDNLRCEKYIDDWRHDSPLSVLTELYYLARPMLPVGIRRHLQKLYLRGWEKIPFPRWPVDTSVDNLLRAVAVAVDSIERGRADTFYLVLA